MKVKKDRLLTRAAQSNEGSDFHHGLPGSAVAPAFPNRENGFTGSTERRIARGLRAIRVTNPPRAVIPVVSVRVSEIRTLKKGATMRTNMIRGAAVLGCVAFSKTGPATFEVEQNLNTRNGARTVTFDEKTGHLFTMSQERGPAPPPPPGGGRPPQGQAIPGSFTILMVGK